MALAAWVWALLLGVGGCGTEPPKQERPPELTVAQKKQAYNVDAETLRASVHAKLDCSDCHTARKGQSGTSRMPSVDCRHCHAEAAKAHDKSVHGEALAHGEEIAARCQDCHGAHDILRAQDPKSQVYKMRQPFTCAKCHSRLEIHDIRAPRAGSQYMESTHGRGLLKDGLIVAPSCSDCHGLSHSMLRASNPNSKVHHTQVPHTCGKCHLGIEDVYDKSVHGKLLLAGDPRGPVCVDCHTSHQISVPTVGKLKLEIDERCGKCHQDRLERYQETYHGRAIQLGQQHVAACSDCHGHHNVLPSSDPESQLHANNRLATCRNCHEGAPANFAGYLTHGDHTDRVNYPILYYVFFGMTMLLLGVFAFFGVHTILWFVRSLVFWRKNPEAFREARKVARMQKEGQLFVRFRPVDRFNHFLVITSFLLLVLTGMPLKFYYTNWAKWMFAMMGGAEAAAALHRLGAGLTLIYFAVHVVSMLGLLWSHKRDFRDEGGKFRIRRVLGFVFGPDSPMPNWQDVRDFVAHQRWFFGRGAQPQFDRWTYWEKFDYLAVFWGVFIIGLSGLVMWFPETATRLLPGWTINIAHVIHSDEALLAAGFIFTFHFFNVHFRVEKFPMDSVIFSGRITEGEMLHERRKLYDRLKAAGRLDDERVTDEWERWKKIFTPIGVIAFSIGVVLIIAIYVAMASRLLKG